MKTSSTIIRFTRTERNEPSGRNIVYGAAYLNPLPAHFDPAHYELIEVDGETMYPTTFAMEASISVRSGWGSDRKLEVDVSSGSSGLTLPEMSAKARVLSLAIREAQEIQDEVDRGELTEETLKDRFEELHYQGHPTSFVTEVTEEALAILPVTDRDRSIMDLRPLPAA